MTYDIPPMTEMKMPLYRLKPRPRWIPKWLWTAMVKRVTLPTGKTMGFYDLWPTDSPFLSMIGKDDE